MRRFRFVIHIGTEKTGTKTLQQTLLDNRFRLLDQGVHYLTSPGRVEARGFAAAATDADVQDDYLDALQVHGVEARQAFRESVGRDLQASLQALPAKVHTVVISSEHFHSRLRFDPRVARLHAMLSPFAESFQVVAYLRRQVDMLASFYSTELKNGGTRELETLARRECHPGNTYYHFEAMLARWAKVFGEPNVAVGLFDPAHWQNGRLVTDFLHRSGLSEAVSELPTSTVLNESVSPEGQALLLALNRYQAALPLDQRALAEWTAARDRISQACAGRGRALPVALATACQAAFEESNQALCRRWFPTRESLFAPVSVPGEPSAALGERLKRLEAALTAWVAESEAPSPAAFLQWGVQHLNQPALIG